MRDLKNPRLLYLKGALFLCLGLLAASLLLLDHPSLLVLLQLALAIWGFCRAYYFAFYVIEHYVDGAYHFAGLGSFLAYLLRKRR
jgi:hypothetical protein